MNERATSLQSIDEDANEISAADLLQSLLQNNQKQSAEKNHIQGILIGHINNIDDKGQLWVSYSNANFPLVANTLSAITRSDINRQCALMFENGNPLRPMIMGLLQEPVITVAAPPEQEAISATESIELRCGKAAIIMNADGKIEIRGTKITSHSSGLNQIFGASVKFN